MECANLNVQVILRADCMEITMAHKQAETMFLLMLKRSVVLVAYRTIKYQL